MLHFKDEFETPDLKIIRHCIGSFAVNTYLLICKKTHAAAIIDPGGEKDAILQCIEENSAKIDYLLFTHTHIDHIVAADALKKALPQARIAYHAKEQAVVENIPDMCRMFGVPTATMPPLEVDLEKFPEFSLGNLQIRALETPGHTPGGVCFYLAENAICFTGDTLFKGSVGRTDFEGGNGSDLRKSLDKLIDILPDNVKILPGHGKFSTMKDEKLGNFYLRIDRFR